MHEHGFLLFPSRLLRPSRVRLCCPSLISRPIQLQESRRNPTLTRPGSFFRSCSVIFWSFFYRNHVTQSFPYLVVVFGPFRVDFNHFRCFNIASNRWLKSLRSSRPVIRLLWRVVHVRISDKLEQLHYSDILVQNILARYQSKKILIDNLCIK